MGFSYDNNIFGNFTYINNKIPFYGIITQSIKPNSQKSLCGKKMFIVIAESYLKKDIIKITQISTPKELQLLSFVLLFFSLDPSKKPQNSLKFSIRSFDVSLKNFKNDSTQIFVPSFYIILL